LLLFLLLLLLLVQASPTERTTRSMAYMQPPRPTLGRALWQDQALPTPWVTAPHSLLPTHTTGTAMQQAPAQAAERMPSASRVSHLWTGLAHL
jgi:hypothetical protein